MNLIAVQVLILIAAVEANKKIDILQNRDVARCFGEYENEALLGRDVCYVPNVCTSRNGTFHLARESIRRLMQDNTFEIFQNIWNYGPNVELVDKIPGRNDRRVVFISVDLQGACHFAADIALPVLNLIDPRVRNFLNIPSVTTVWNKLFEPNQHNTEQWIREVVPIFRTRFGIETISGIEMYDSSDTVCFDAMLYVVFECQSLMFYVKNLATLSSFAQTLDCTIDNIKHKQSTISNTKLVLSNTGTTQIIEMMIRTRLLHLSIQMLSETFEEWF